MNFEEGLEIVDEAVLLKVGRRLSEVEISVLKGSWQKQTYDAIAHDTHYAVNYLKIHVGPTLWKLLSVTFGEPVTKNNVCSVVERQGRWLAHSADDGGSRPTTAIIAEETISDTLGTSAATCDTDWGEAVDVSGFYGRTTELATLKQWVVVDRCRLVALLGMGGIGKTALSAKLAHALVNGSEAEFQSTIWRSLRNAPPLETLLGELVAFLSRQQETQGSFSQLIHYLRATRCLVILDNFETVLQSGDFAGQYRPGYEDYRELLQLVGESDHCSCAILTSREKPAEVATIEGIDLRVRSLTLVGCREAAQTLIQAKRATGSDVQKQQLCDRYGNNPLALKIVASSIQDLFDGDIAQFLQEDVFIFNGVRRLLDRQFERLSDAECSIMYWLAINRQWTAVSQLQADIVPGIAKVQLLEALESLSWRSLIESRSGSYTQQPVVMEYVTERLFEQVVTELETENLDFFVRFSLIKTTVEDYVRESQVRLILGAIAEQFCRTFGMISFETTQPNPNLAQPILGILNRLHGSPYRLSGYGGGNLINLCCYLHLDLTDYDFSGLCIRHAYLQNIPLPRVNFAQANLRQSVFTQTFSAVTQVTFSPNGHLLAAAAVDGQIRLWQDIDYHPISILIGHHNWVWSIAFSADSQLLASGSGDETIKLWEASTGNLLRTLTGHGGQVLSVAFSPDNLLLASSSADQTVKIWHVPTGNLLKTLQGHCGWVRSVVFGPFSTEQGWLLASGGDDQTINLWGVDLGLLDPDRPPALMTQCLATLVGHDGPVLSVALSTAPSATFRENGVPVATGTILASSSADTTVKLWAISPTAVRNETPGRSPARPNATRAREHWPGIVYHGQLLKTLQGHRNWIRSICFSPDGTLLASASDDQTVKIWDTSALEIGRLGTLLRTLQGHTNWVWSVALSQEEIAP
ncbi:MAG: NB-ARC domain-containing protein, partial [Thermosynechococcaceae cyanobacterium]